MTRNQFKSSRTVRHLLIGTSVIAMLAISAGVSAQTAVEVVRRSYRETPALPIETAAAARAAAEAEAKAAQRTSGVNAGGVREAKAAPDSTLAAASEPKALPFESAPESLKANNQWDVTPTDQTLRITLVRWASRAGWSFSPDYWTPDRDLPVVASARFDGDFKSVVRHILKSSEMTDLPVQPCFYSNKVLRVVGKSEACQRLVATTVPTP